jgi:hypothetical protein
VATKAKTASDSGMFSLETRAVVRPGVKFWVGMSTTCYLH